MKNYKGSLNTKLWWIVPYLVAFSKANVNDRAIVYSLHITQWFQIGINKTIN